MTVTPLRSVPEDIDPLLRLANIEAEQALLGALFYDSRAYEHVVDLVSPEDFSHPWHGEIFRAIGRNLECGAPVNPAGLKNHFEPERWPYLAKLAIDAALIGNPGDYARLVADLAERREIILAAREAIVEAESVDIERPAEIILDAAEERLFGIATRRQPSAGPRSLGVCVADVIATIETAYKRGGTLALPSGLIDLDRISGGMGAGELHVLAGRPGMGKSAAAGSIALNVARAGRHVLFFSLEMTRAELTARWLATLTGISTEEQRKGDLDPGAWDRIFAAANEIKALPLLVDDQPRLSVAQMRQRARRVRRRHGLDLIIVDHLQLIRLGGKQESRRVEVGEASGMLKALAKELGVPILLLSQLNRDVERRENKRPMLADLRESGDIEQDADVVLLLYREGYYLERDEPRRRGGETCESFNSRYSDWTEQCEGATGIAEIAVAKNRHGRTGMARVYFDAARQKFGNLVRHS